VRLGGAERRLVTADGTRPRCDREGFSDGEDFYPSEGEQVFGIMLWSAMTLEFTRQAWARFTRTLR
jgi:hypothetical protein